MIQTVFVLILALVSLNTYAESNCSEKFDHKGFIHKIVLGGKVLKAELSKVQECANKNAEQRDKLDFGAIEMLTILDNGELDKAYRTQKLVHSIISVLEFSAKAGSHSAQHNLASIYNSDPSAEVYKLIKNDHKKFVYWTRQAASNGDPRSMLNLASRMIGINGKGVEGIPVDYEKALKLLMAIIVVGKQYDISYLMPTIQAEMSKLKNHMDEKRMRELIKEMKSFNLKQLAAE